MTDDTLASATGKAGDATVITTDDVASASEVLGSPVAPPPVDPRGSAAWNEARSEVTRLEQELEVALANLKRIEDEGETSGLVS